MVEVQTHSGGCQCGAVRFRVAGALGDASICHCRMCQKAFGAFYAPLVTVREGSLEWTRGAPKFFQSSNHAFRGFCENCGTPLSYRAPDGVGLAIGAFDDPAEVRPRTQWGIEAKLPYTDELAALPGSRTEEDMTGAPFLSDLTSFQHPDYDTEEWPPRSEK